MIVVEEEQQLRIITQPDHAYFSAELLKLWRIDGLPDHPRRSDLLFAVREHDNGWREPDAAPLVNHETGKPHDFISIPEQTRLELWIRGVVRFAESRPYSAMLIAEHARVLHSEENELWRDFLADLQERRQRFLEMEDQNEAVLANDYTYLRLADKLSLSVCTRSLEEMTFAGTRSRALETSLLLDPFPLAGSTTFQIPCRWIPNRRYESDADLGIELASAPWNQLEIGVKPA